ncbi:MAG TPA: DUF883 family protein [Verrucomicrobiae bacterium]|nr:DUF883 family protein [Verrucomicrobiae bacterium]
MDTPLEGMNAGKAALARERVTADLKTLARDAEDLLKATAGDLSEKAKAARARLGVALEHAKVTCGELQQQTLAAAKKTDVVIRQHPYETIGIAFGLGLLIGVLATRK